MFLNLFYLSFIIYILIELERRILRRRIEESFLIVYFNEVTIKNTIFNSKESLD